MEASKARARALVERLIADQSAKAKGDGEKTAADKYVSPTGKGWSSDPPGAPEVDLTTGMPKLEVKQKTTFTPPNPGTAVSDARTQMFGNWKQDLWDAYVPRRLLGMSTDVARPQTSRALTNPPARVALPAKFTTVTSPQLPGVSVTRSLDDPRGTATARRYLTQRASFTGTHALRPDVTNTNPYLRTVAGDFDAHPANVDIGDPFVGAYAHEKPEGLSDMHRSSQAEAAGWLPRSTGGNWTPIRKLGPPAPLRDGSRPVAFSPADAWYDRGDRLSEYQLEHGDRLERGLRIGAEHRPMPPLVPPLREAQFNYYDADRMFERAMARRAGPDAVAAAQKALNEAAVGLAEARKAPR